MARRLSWGTPGGRAARYFQPRPAFTRVLLALGLGAAALVGSALLEAGGRFFNPLRVPLMPGALIARHGSETGARCLACHSGARVTNLRCQRCHDEAGPGRMTQVAHAGRHYDRLRGGDADAAASVANLECVRCHVEHRGTQEKAAARMVAVDDGQCVTCHGRKRTASDGERPLIADLSGHPEFAAKRAQAEKPQPGEPQAMGAYFSHKKHFVQARKALQKQAGAAPSDEAVCRSCHALGSGVTGHRDFAPIESGAHCFSCHDHQDDLKMSPIPASEASAEESENPCRGEEEERREFDCSDGSVRKTAVVHRDPWIRARVDRLRKELYPEAHEGEVASLLERQYRLGRRLLLGQMLATLETKELEARRSDVSAELAGFEARAKDTGAAAAPPAQRVEEVLAALAAGGEKDAALAAQLESLRAAQPSAAAADFEARRAELLDLLDAIAVAEPAFKARAQQLRLRLTLAAAGDAAGSSDRRGLAQRRDDLSRLEDELTLRRQGVAQRPPPQRAAEDQARSLAALTRTRTRLAELRRFEGVAPSPPQDRARKEAALLALLGKARDSGCVRCHVVEKASFLPLALAQPVLTLAEFRHEVHLGAATPRPGLAARLLGRAAQPPAAAPSGSCESCHPGMKESQEAYELHLEGIASCQACHGAGLSDKCQLCHRYHPPGLR